MALITGGTGACAIVAWFEVGPCGGIVPAVVSFAEATPRFSGWYGRAVVTGAVRGGRGVPTVATSGDLADAADDGTALVDGAVSETKAPFGPCTAGDNVVDASSARRYPDFRACSSDVNSTRSSLFTIAYKAMPGR